MVGADDNRSMLACLDWSNIGPISKASMVDLLLLAQRWPYSYLPTISVANDDKTHACWL